MSKRSPYQQQRILLTSLLKQIRKQQNITQNTLAKKLNKPQSFVSKYENGERILDVVEIYQICLALSMPFIELMEQFDHKISLLHSGRGEDSQ